MRKHSHIAFIDLTSKNTIYQQEHIHPLQVLAHVKYEGIREISGIKFRPSGVIFRPF